MRRKMIDRKKVKELFRKGLSDDEIAKKLKCSLHTVLFIRRELRLYRRDKNLKKKVLNLWKIGYRSPSSIAFRLKKHPIVISNILVNLGLRKKLKLKQKDVYYKMYEVLLKEPMFESELKKLGFNFPREYYKTLVLKGYKVDCIEYKKQRIYFIPEQKNIAISKFLKRFPTASLYNQYKPLEYG